MYIMLNGLIILYTHFNVKYQFLDYFKVLTVMVINNIMSDKIILNFLKLIKN
jgi:hypothetical protein